jgi:signal transduction histidine kinase/CheY-like chemotaxis protein
VAKTAELELRDTMSRLTTLLAHMQTGVLVEDANRRVVMANDTLCGLFRCADQPDSLVGLPVTAAVRHLMRPDDEPARFVRRTEELVQQRWPATNQSLELGDSRVLEFDFAPIVTDGQDLGALWMFRDATDRVQYQDALARARDEAIAASDAKTQFLASMSHEIRTPMHGVLATVDLLQTTRLDPEQRELVDVVSTSAASLVQIINDILDLSKVEAGRIELGAEAFAPADLLRGVADLLGSQARAKGLALSMYVDPAIPAALVGDPLRLRQVLVNLVGNAVKFTTQGSVALEVRLAQRRASDCVVEFEVRDTGEGIAADRLAAIFDPFVQARAGKEGTGLGLAIAERIVTVMGGQIQVASVLGEGSTFRFRVRLAEPTDGSDDPGADRPEPEPVVLLVDDSDASRRLALRLLARLGVTAHAVASGQEALDALEAGPTYGLVLMDADMPGLDGPRTTELVRASRDRHVATVPVFAIIGGDDRELLDRCRDSGMDGHVSKPVDITELRRLLDAVLGVAPR